MAHDRQTAELYDFLYKDVARLASYYAQIYGGRLTAFEESASDRSTSSKSGKAGVSPVITGEMTAAQETLETTKRTVDPHDVIATDVLAALARDQRMNRDCVAATHGALVLVQGTIGFVDRMLAETALTAVNAVIGNLPPGGDGGQPPPLGVLNAVIAFIRQITIPSAFFLQTNDGHLVAGTIKEAGMEEPISTYYFKHGMAGLAGVYLVGIKEVPSPTFSLPTTQLIGAGQQAAQSLSDMIFPKEAIRVTPIALFRKL